MTTLRWLAVDGALGAFSAAVLAPSGETAAGTAGNDALERGIAMVDGVLARAGLRLEEIDALATGTGPGSFTGVRIAVSYAKGLALALGRPLAGVSSYEVLDDGSTPPPVLAVVPGRSGIACARLRTEGGLYVRCGGYDDVVELVAGLVAPSVIACYGGVEGVVTRLGERGFTVRASPLPEFPALTIARLAAGRPASAAPAHGVQPDYGELPAATVRLRIP